MGVGMKRLGNQNMNHWKLTWSDIDPGMHAGGRGRRSSEFKGSLLYSVCVRTTEKAS